MHLRERARRHLPRVVFDFVDGGADDEVTLRRNRAAFDDLALIPRILAGVGEVSTETELFGQRMAMPVLLSPVGGLLVIGPEGFAATAAGAVAAEVVSVQAWQPKVVSGAESTAPRQWYQLSLNQDRDGMAEAVKQAKGLGYKALVLTGDGPVVGNRERDLRNGLSVPLRLVTPRIARDVIRRPRWLWGVLHQGVDRAAGLELGRMREVKSLSEAVLAELNPHQTWEDLRWLRELWDGPLLLKGVMCSEDAELAIEAGCDGVIVSSHGGRQLDGIPASIEVLPEVAEAVSGRVAVLLDSGVRRGTDVIKALCLGADACMLGRPWVYAVAIGGAAGVTRMLERVNEELVRDLQLLGAKSIDDLEPRFVRRREGARWQRIDGSKELR